MARRVSARRVKKHRLYTYDEAGNVVGVTGDTIRSWRAGGLQVMAASKPHYILGAELISFVKRKQQKRAIKGALDQMYCVTCKTQTKPFGGLVDYIPITDTRGQLMGLCGTCERPLYRFASKASLCKFDGIYDIAIKGAS